MTRNCKVISAQMLCAFLLHMHGLGSYFYASLYAWCEQFSVTGWIISFPC
uniref:Uncharacterized protein n=1 Tax=Rhizophora mucronata TaxID=61149 RepID=A0A2P2QR86_RHIMU